MPTDNISITSHAHPDADNVLCISIENISRVPLLLSFTGSTRLKHVGKDKTDFVLTAESPLQANPGETVKLALTLPFSIRDYSPKARLYLCMGYGYSYGDGQAFIPLDPESGPISS